MLKIAKYRLPYVIGWLELNRYSPEMPVIYDPLAGGVKQLPKVDPLRSLFAAVRCDFLKAPFSMLLWATKLQPGCEILSHCVCIKSKETVGWSSCVRRKAWASSLDSGYTIAFSLCRPAIAMKPTCLIPLGPLRAARVIFFHAIGHGFTSWAWYKSRDKPLVENRNEILRECLIPGELSPW